MVMSWKSVLFKIAIVVLHECQAGAYGLDCSLTLEDMETLQSFRQELCENLKTQISFTDMDTLRKLKVLQVESMR